MYLFALTLFVSRIDSPDAFDRMEANWKDDLIEALRPTGRIEWPDSLAFNFSLRDRTHVLEAAIKLKGAGLKTARQMAEAFSSGLIDTRLDVEEFVSGTLSESAARHYRSLEISETKELKWRNRLAAHWSRFLNDLDLRSIQLRSFVEGTEFHFQVAARYREIYGAHLITQNVIDRAAFPLIGARLLADSRRQELKSPRSIAAYSFLFPIMDDGLDQKYLDPESLRRISDFLEGKSVQPKNDYERIVFDLIREIQSEFPESSDPLVMHMLRKLHQAQMCANEIQRNQRSTREDILVAEIAKGGLTSALGSYLAVGRLTDGELESDYKTGLLFQLGDDLADLVEDQNFGIRTLWTVGPSRFSNPYVSGLESFLKVHRHLEATFEKTILNPDARRARVSSAALISRAYLFGAYISDQHPDFFRRALSRKIPMSAGNVSRVITAMNRHLAGSENITSATLDAFQTLLRTLDHHILNGSLERDDKRYSPRTSAKRIYRIRSLNPLSPLIKVAHGIEELLKRPQL